MTWLPVVDRELRCRARRGATYGLRVAVAAAALLAALWVVSGFGPVPAPQAGGVAFSLLAWAAYVFCCVEGARQTHDSLSSERRDGTLGLLFLTDLRAYDVVLGKLAAAGLGSLYGVLALLPALALPLLAGGVTAGEVWRTGLALLATLFFSLTAGLWVSSGRLDPQRALLGALTVILGATVLPLALEALWSFAQAGAQTATAALLSPAYPFVTASDRVYRLQPGSFWLSLVIVHLGAWAFLALACRGARRGWREAEGPAVSTPSPCPRPQVQPEQAHRRALLDQDPLRWLASRSRGQRRLAWIAVALAASPGALAVLGARRMGSGSRIFWQVQGWGGLLVEIIGDLLVASIACRTFVEARRSGAMELLLTAPLRDQDFAKGQWRALLAVFRLPVLFLLLWQLITMRVDLAAAPLYLAAELTHLLALCWVGMWLGASLPKATHAAIRTVLYVTIIPTIFWMLAPVGYIVLRAFGWPMAHRLLSGALPLLFNCAVCGWARRRLLTRFRMAAAQSPELRGGLARLGRWARAFFHRARTWQTD